MAETKGLSTGTSVNLPELLDRVDNDRELLRDLLSIFTEEFPRHFCALQEAVAGRDAKRVAVVSHTLKGMLLNLAVTKAAGSLQERNLIQYSRGNITVLDRRGLKAAACTCYKADLESYTRMLA